MLDRYQLVQLKNGTFSVRSNVDAETFHPVIGPVAEAEALYVRQLRLVDRLRASTEEFVVWDVGLGSAANPLTFVNAASSVPRRLRIISFDHTLEPLRFALHHAQALGYLEPFRPEMSALLQDHRVDFGTSEGLEVSWEFHLGDFPSLLKSPTAQTLAKPNAVFYDAFSPQKNPTMWTLEVFSNLFHLLDPQKPSAMPTYSRSTLLRTTLLLAGFFVGVGHATGEKEETTIAANTLELIEEPLDLAWLARARRSRSAEPLRTPEYRQAPLLPETLEKLSEHPQFR